MLAINLSVAANAPGSCEGVNGELGGDNSIRFRLLADRPGTCQILCYRFELALQNRLTQWPCVSP